MTEEANIDDLANKGDGSDSQTHIIRDLEVLDHDRVKKQLEHKKYLENRVLEFTAAVNAEKDVEPTSDDPEQLLSRIYTLQKELIETSCVGSLKEILIHRLQLGQTLIQVLNTIPQNAGDTSPNIIQQKTEIINLMEEQITVVARILRKGRVNNALKERIESAKEKNKALMKENRELHSHMLKTKELQKETAIDSNDERAKKVKKRIDSVKSQVTITQNIFQGLILGSGVNWAQDSDLSELLLSLGHHVDTHIENFHKNE